jgi:hypothetical protein
MTGIAGTKNMVMVRLAHHLPVVYGMAGFALGAGIGVVVIEMMTVGAGTKHLIVLDGGR